MLQLLKKIVVFSTICVFIFAVALSYKTKETLETPLLRKEIEKQEIVLEKEEKDYDDGVFKVKYSEKKKKEEEEEVENNKKDERRDEDKSLKYSPTQATDSESGDLLSQLERLKVKLNTLERERKVYPEVKFLSYKDRRRVLVTGGAGFVGSHLVDKLMLLGHEVTVVDNFFTGRKRNVEQWIGHQNFELLNHDVINDVHIEVDRIYHLASPASPPHYMYNPIKTIKTNTIGTINMLGLAKRVRARLLFASTSEVYGDPEVHPQGEEYWGHVNPIGPRACYDEAKRVGETLCYAYHKQEGVDVRVARIFNTFGPRMHMNDGRVVSNFILQALQQQPMTIYGSGTQTRSFQYVTDLVNGLVLLMESNYSKPVNLGNPEEHTIEDFASIIQQLLGGHSQIVHKPPVVDDPQRRKPNISVAITQLAWSPKVPLLTGINKTIEYFRNELSRKKHSERNLWSPEKL